MTDAATAFHTFWAQFRNPKQPDKSPIPAYQAAFAVWQDKSGKPSTSGGPYPRITYELGVADFLQNTALTASVWHRDPQNPGNTGIINNILEQIAKAIPAHGAEIELESGGAFFLYRDAASFISFTGDPADPAITRGIVRYWVRNRTNT